MPALNRRKLAAAAFGLALVAALALPYLRPRPASRYTVTDLGVLPGDAVSSASGINNHGDIVGFSSSGEAYERRVFLYAHGRMAKAGQGEGVTYEGQPFINNSGQINRRQRLSSHAVLSRSESHQAIFYSGSQKIRFVMPLRWERADLLGMNDQGQVIGSYRQTIGNPSRISFVYDSKTRKFSTLPQPPGGWEGFAGSINDHGQIAGIAWQPGRDRAVLWNAGQPVFLPTVPGRDSSEGLGINNQGDIVGTAWSLPNAAAQYVNDYPQRWRLLVPFFKKQWENRAVFYKGGKAQDLNSLIPEDAGWTLEEANSINDQGQIVGEGLHHGLERAFLLTPMH